MARPDDDIACVVDVHRRPEAAVAGLGDDDVRGPSRLPGWTVARLLTHVAVRAPAAPGSAGGRAVGSTA
jgi:hypothetical protein